MITKEMIREDLRLHGASTEDSNVDAGYEFMRHFGALDSNTVEEAHEKVLISMEIISDEMEANPDRAGEIIKSRYSGFAEEM